MARRRTGVYAAAAACGRCLRLQVLLLKAARRAFCHLTAAAPSSPAAHRAVASLLGSLKNQSMASQSACAPIPEGGPRPHSPLKWISTQRSSPSSSGAHSGKQLHPLARDRPCPPVATYGPVAQQRGCEACRAARAVRPQTKAASPLPAPACAALLQAAARDRVARQARRASGIPLRPNPRRDPPPRPPNAALSPSDAHL